MSYYPQVNTFIEHWSRINHFCWTLFIWQKGIYTYLMVMVMVVLLIQVLHLNNRERCTSKLYYVYIAGLNGSVVACIFANLVHWTKKIEKNNYTVRNLREINHVIHASEGEHVLIYTCLHILDWKSRLVSLFTIRLFRCSKWKSDYLYKHF